jgi:hypothetical protein
MSEGNTSLKDQKPRGRTTSWSQVVALHANTPERRRRAEVLQSFFQVSGRTPRDVARVLRATIKDLIAGGDDMGLARYCRVSVNELVNPALPHPTFGVLAPVTPGLVGGTIGLVDLNLPRRANLQIPKGYLPIYCKIFEPTLPELQPWAGQVLVTYWASTFEGKVVVVRKRKPIVIDHAQVGPEDITLGALIESAQTKSRKPAVAAR